MLNFWGVNEQWPVGAPGYIFAVFFGGVIILPGYIIGIITQLYRESGS